MKRKLTFISAGAGSGKTYRLTELLHDRLINGAVVPGGVIATTFTRKAATELRERVRSHLLSKNRMDLANSMGEAMIGTVNSVCGSMLQRFAFEVGLSPDLRVLEDAESQQFIRQELDAAVDEASRQELTSIARRLGIEDWRDQIGELIKQVRSNDIDPGLLPEYAEKNADALLGHFPRPLPKDPTEALGAAIKKQLPELLAAAENSTVKKTAAYLERLAGFQRKMEWGVTWAEWLELAGDAPEKALVPLSEPIALLASQYEQHPQLHADIRDYLRLTFKTAAMVLERYAKRKRELGTMDFTDQEAILLHHIDHPAIAECLKEELDLLLVDEFQDTSPIQLALFMKLAGFAKETIWVGDIKQAIYGFRGSDTALMESVIAALPSLGGKTEILASSWRSRPALVELVNKVFVPAFSDLLDKKQVALKAERPELTQDPAFEVWQLEGKNLDLRIRGLAAQIRQAVESGTFVVDRAAKALRKANFGDIAVLCRSHSRVASVSSALAALGVPSATAESGLLAKPEAALALACLRRLNDPEDTVSVAEILSLADCLEPEEWLADRLAYIQAQGTPSEWLQSGDGAHPIISAIAGLRAQLPLLTPKEALERVVSHCDLAGRIVAWCRDEGEASRRLANLDVLLAMAARYEDVCRTARRPGSLSGLLLWFGDQAAAGEDTQAPVQADAVQVMTHHAAKGLEWPIVILVDLDMPNQDRLWGVSAESTTALDISAPLKNRFIRFWPWPFGSKQKAPVVDRIAQTADAVRRQGLMHQEMLRLLYVSMTRARDKLVFALGSTKWKSDSWLAVTQAEWLLTGMQSGQAVLPAGMGIPSELKVVQVSDEPISRTKKLRQLHWFGKASLPSQRLPLFVYPSAADARDCSSLEAESFGGHVAVGPGADRAMVGTAIHACLAASLSTGSSSLDLDLTRRLIRRFGLEAHLDADQLLSLCTSIITWLNARWPAGKILAEMPIVTMMESGQILKGQIDLLALAEDAIAVIDHKTGSYQTSMDAAVLSGYAGQLHSYGRHLGPLLEGRKVSYFVVLPELGRAIPLVIS